MNYLSIYLELGDDSKGAELALVKPGGDECGSCYGARPLAANGCCNTCDEVRQAYANMGWGMGSDLDQFEQCVRENWREKIEKQSNEGCNVHGQISVNKVRGNFHFAPGQSFQQANMHIHDLQNYVQGAADGHAFDMSHAIHSLRFGPEASDLQGAITDALAGTVKRTDKCMGSFFFEDEVAETDLR